MGILPCQYKKKKKSERIYTYIKKLIGGSYQTHFTFHFTYSGNPQSFSSPSSRIIIILIPPFLVTINYRLLLPTLVTQHYQDIKGL